MALFPDLPAQGSAVTLDARDGALPALIREWDAGVASSSAHPLALAGAPLLGPPVAAPAAAPSGSNPSGSSLELPFFISNSSASLSTPAPSPCLFPIPQDSCWLKKPAAHTSLSGECHDDHRSSLFCTFYFPPSASRSSGALSLCASRDEAQSIMAGLTFDVPAHHRFEPLDQTDAGYFTSMTASDCVHNDTTARLRPHSAGSGRSERTASPLNFARWTRWHHRHHHSNNHNRHPGDEYDAAERKESSGRSSPKRLGRSRSTSVQKRPHQPGAVPQMTREEFEALPLAIRRKYFSTLERLRFAQESGLVDGISQHYDAISSFKSRRPRPNRSASEHPVGRTRRESVDELHSPTTDSLWSGTGLSEGTEGGVSQSSQVPRGLRHRASVILDAADEAVFKLNRQASRRNLSTPVDVLTPPCSPTRHSMDSQHGPGALRGPSDGQVPQSFFESFRWLDEEEDLDLRLFLDDYHANLREGTPTTNQRPSFRRHMSINKSPFGRRSSVSSTRPRTNDAVAPAPQAHTPTGSVTSGPTHTRRKSRALSLITPKHAPQSSISAFDPAAAHYQDPEARLKLRVYLASPQKFDEAVEFGFPSADVLSAAPAFGADAVGPSRRQSRQKLADGNSTMRTFLADHDDEDDENVSLYSDGQSLADPDSPKTPEPMEHRPGVPRHTRYASAGLLSSRDPGRKTPEGGFYAQAPATSREMTLRMTLTRPDLRAHEDEIYGWQQKQAYHHHARRATGLASLAAENKAAQFGSESQKGSVEKFPEMDHWNDNAAEKGVMRRIWNRVRRV